MTHNPNPRGRPVGSPNKVTAATRARIEAEADPLGFLASIQNGDEPLSKFSIEHRSVWRKRFESIPFDRIVTGGNLQSTRCVMVSDQHSTCRRRADAGIKHFTPGRQQACDDSVLNHRPRRSPIPGDNHFTPAEDGSQSRRKPRCVNRIQPIAYDAS